MKVTLARDYFQRTLSIPRGPFQNIFEIISQLNVNQRCTVPVNFLCTAQTIALIINGHTVKYIVKTT